MEKSEKGLMKLKKQELVNIILRKDDVDKAKNVRCDELGTKLSASEKLIEELKNNSSKFKTDYDALKQKYDTLNRTYAESNSKIVTLKRTRDDYANEVIKLSNRNKELITEIKDLNDKLKANKFIGITGVIFIIAAIVLLLLF